MRKKTSIWVIMLRTCLIVLLWSFVLSPMELFSQAQGKVQKGFVRSQSFVDKPSHSIEGVTIRRKDRTVLDAVSDDKGYFELSMENLDSKGLYYIDTVISADKDYKLLMPKLNEQRQYTPYANLEIVMTSETERKDFIERNNEELETRLKRSEDSIKHYYDSLHKINQISLDSLLRACHQLEEITKNNLSLRKTYIENLAYKDYESTDETNREASLAIKEGRYDEADRLLKDRFGTIESIVDAYIRAEEEVRKINEDVDKENKQRLDACDNYVGLALGRFDYQEALKNMKERIKIAPTNIDYLLALGQLEEIQFNDYSNAIEYYTQALEQSAIQFSPRSPQVAIFHNHLGDVYEVLCELVEAENHYSQAKDILESIGDIDSKHIFDAYLGLGKVNENYWKYNEAIAFYDKCIRPDVAQINNKAYMIARIGVAQVNSSLGRYVESKNEFDSLLAEISKEDDPDVEILCKAYGGVISCLIAIGQYQEAIELSESAIDYLSKRTVGDNIFISGILQLEAMSLANLGQVKESEACMNRAQATYSAVLGESHPLFASSSLMMANYYLSIGELVAAKELTNKALQALNAKFGKNHIATIYAHEAKAVLHYKYYEYDEALAEYDTIRNIYKEAKLLNEFNRCLIDYYEADIKAQMGETKKAISVFKNTINVISDNVGSDAILLFNLYNDLASAYLNLGDFDNALFYINKCQEQANWIYGEKSPNTITQKILLGNYHELKGDFGEAFEIYSSVEQSLQSIFGENNFNLIGIYAKLGNYYLNQYRFDKAKSYFDLQYEITKASYGEDHFLMADALANLGTYESYFHPDLQLSYAQDAYNLLVARFGEGHNYTLRALSVICNSYVQLGRFAEAKGMLRQLKTYVEKGMGKKCGFYAGVFAMEAMLYQYMDDFKNAIECTNRAIGVYEKLDGPYCPNTLPLYKQLGGYYEARCEFKKANEYCDLALSIARDRYGENSLETMSVMLAKSQQLTTRCQYAEAHEILNSVKRFFVDYYGPSSMQLCPVSMQEAQLMLNEGYLSQSIDTLLQVKSVMESTYGEDNPQMCGLYNTLASSYLTNGQMEYARLYYQKSLSIIESTYGSMNSNCLMPLDGLGKVALNVETNARQASLFFMRAAIIAATVFGYDNPNTALTDAQLGIVSLRMGDFLDAFQKFSKYQEIIEKTSSEGVSPPSRVADAHTYWGQYYLAKAQYAIVVEHDSIQTVDYATQAISSFEKAKQVLEAVFGENSIHTVSCLYGMASVQLFIQDFESALANYRKAAQISIDWFGEESPLVADAYLALGDAYLGEFKEPDQEQLEHALNCYQKALSIKEKTEGNTQEYQKTSTFGIKDKIAGVYQRMGEYDTVLSIAYELIEELETIDENNHDDEYYYQGIRFSLFNYYINTATIHLQSDLDVEQALELFTKAQTLLPKLQMPDNNYRIQLELQVLFGFAYSYEVLEHNQEAIDYYERILDILEANHSPQDQIDFVLEKLEDLRDE